MSVNTLARIVGKGLLQSEFRRRICVVRIILNYAGLSHLLPLSFIETSQVKLTCNNDQNTSTCVGGSSPGTSHLLKSFFLKLSYLSLLLELDMVPQRTPHQKWNSHKVSIPERLHRKRRLRLSMYDCP